LSNAELSSVKKYSSSFASHDQKISYLTYLLLRGAQSTARAKVKPNAFALPDLVSSSN
jgi:hypothetical protein